RALKVVFAQPITRRDRLDAMRALDHVAEALSKGALPRGEGFGSTFKGIAAGREIEDREWHAHTHSTGPVPAHEGCIVPIFHVGDHAWEQAGFEARFEALEVAAERIVEVIVATVDANLRVFAEAGNQEAELRIEALQRRLAPLEDARASAAIIM